jgi:hypothetical protein
MGVRRAVATLVLFRPVGDRLSGIAQPFELDLTACLGSSQFSAT